MAVTGMDLSQMAKSQSSKKKKKLKLNAKLWAKEALAFMKALQARPGFKDYITRPFK